MGINKKLLTIILMAALTLSMIAPLTGVLGQNHNTLFKVTIIAPGNANLLRRQWSQVFASNLQQLGIDANVVYLDWTSVYDRALTPSPDMVGKTYDQGGYDILALGWTPGLVPEPRQTYYGGDPAFFAPTGQNYYLWNNSQSNALLDQFITSTNDSGRSSALNQWQSLYYNQVPASQILYQQAPAVVSPHIGNLYTPATGGGEGWLYFNAEPYPQLLTRDDGKTSITYCSTGSIDALNPPESDSWYDVIVSAPIFDGLAETWPTLNGMSDLETPALLTSWSHSADGFTWTFNCRQGVTWQDGYPFTANDVLFSLWALMNPDTGSQFVGYYQSVYGDNVQFTYSNGTTVTEGTGTRMGTITATDNNTVVVHLPVCADGKPYGYFEPYLLTFANNIIPMHIFENIAPADWSNSPFNTGQGSMTINGITYTGPVGTGPYKWVSYDPVAQVIHLQKYDNYWNATGLEQMGLFQMKDYYIRFIADGTSALAALKNGEVDMLDYNYQFQTDVPSIDPSWGKVLNMQGVGRQEFGYNMESPIFGTGTATPNGASNPSQAAQYATDVRIAFDYAIPRQLIINNLLSGYGTAGATPMLPTQPYYDSSVQARPYDLNQARHYLQLAGYSPPSATGANIVNLQGTYNDTQGNPVANETVILMQGTTNSTSALTAVSHTVTDTNGFYSFAVNPTAGTYYYYLADNTTGTPVYTYLQSETVSASTTSTSNSMTLYVIIAAVIVIVVVLVAVVALRRRGHKQPQPQPT
jgi:ABC-type transport system substrate-binding protein